MTTQDLLGKEPNSCNPQTPTHSKKIFEFKKIIGGLVLGLIGVIGIYLIYDSYCFVTTDNAMVQAPATLLSSKISGIITKVYVQENETVKQGKPLVEINPADYQNTVDQLQAERDALASDVKGAQSNYYRTLELLKQGASTQEKLDAAQSRYHSLEHKQTSAQAQLAEAKLNLEYTRIVAPADGKVGKKSFEVGMLANVGQPLFGFVANNERWVVANLKETDMSLIKEGKTATIRVDAIYGKTFTGVLESISPATGATFSLLPPDNATGNFTKVIQRVPVRIKFLNLEREDVERLQNGLSAEVKIKVR